MCWNKNILTSLLHIKYPIIQAPMAGGITTPELISAVSNSGGLGNMGTGYMDPIELKENITKIKLLTNSPFGVNLFVPSPPEFLEEDNSLEFIKGILLEIENELDIKDNEKQSNININYQKLFNNQLEEVMRARVPICSFTFGIPPKEVIKELKQNQCTVIGTATNVKEAILLEESGVDIVVAQGSEAGGHRGSFLNEKGGHIGSMALIPQVVDNVSVPVIAAGGIMDARGIVAAMSLGAQGFQMGTAFLCCEESGADIKYKEALLNTYEDQLIMTKVFTGRSARAISNKFVRKMRIFEERCMPFPIQNTLTGNIRKKAKQLGDKEYMSLWAGQGIRLIEENTAKNILNNLLTNVNNLMDN